MHYLFTKLGPRILIVLINYCSWICMHAWSETCSVQGVIIVINFGCFSYESTLEKRAQELFKMVEILVLLDSLCQVQYFSRAYNSCMSQIFGCIQFMYWAHLYCMHHVSQPYSFLCPKVNKRAWNLSLRGTRGIESHKYCDWQLHSCRDSCRACRLDSKCTSLHSLTVFIAAIAY